MSAFRARLARMLPDRVGRTAVPGRIAELGPLRNGALSRHADAMVDALSRTDRPLRVIDIGCRWGASEAWRPFGRSVTLWGFDPDEEECRRLEALTPPDVDHRWVPRAVGAQAGDAVLHLTRDPGSSSLFRPRSELAATYPALATHQVEGEVPLAVTTLDAWAEENGVDAVDVLKVDIQGSELDALRGGERLVSTARVIELEVEFNPIYEGQPLFGDIDAYLRERGFSLWRLGNLVHYGLAGTHVRFDVPDYSVHDIAVKRVRPQGGQLFWGHAYYVSDELLSGGEGATWDAHVRDAAACAAFGWRDLAASALTRALAAAPAADRDAISAALL